MLHSDASDAVAIGAQFYDLTLLPASRGRAQGALKTLPAPTVGVLDVGADTGTPTIMMAETWHLPVHALEPSRSMRIGLLSKLAQRAELTRQVTVHPIAAHQLTRTGFVDLITAFWSVQMITAEHWDRTWTALHADLVPDGCLLIETPTAPTNGTEHHSGRGQFHIGEHTVEHDWQVERAVDGAGTGTFRYRRLDENGDILYEDANEYLYPPDEAPRDLHATLQQLGMLAERSIPDSGPGDASFTLWRKPIAGRAQW